MFLDPHAGEREERPSSQSHDYCDSSFSRRVSNLASSSVQHQQNVNVSRHPSSLSYHHRSSSHRRRSGRKSSDNRSNRRDRRSLPSPPRQHRRHNSHATATTMTNNAVIDCSSGQEYQHQHRLVDDLLNPSSSSTSSHRLHPPPSSNIVPISHPPGFGELNGAGQQHVVSRGRPSCPTPLGVGGALVSDDDTACTTILFPTRGQTLPSSSSRRNVDDEEGSPPPPPPPGIVSDGAVDRCLQQQQGAGGIALSPIRPHRRGQYLARTVRRPSSNRADVTISGGGSHRHHGGIAATSSGEHLPPFQSRPDDLFVHHGRGSNGVGHGGEATMRWENIHHIDGSFQPASLDRPHTFFSSTPSPHEQQQQQQSLYRGMTTMTKRDVMMPPPPPPPPPLSPPPSPNDSVHKTRYAKVKNNLMGIKGSSTDNNAMNLQQHSDSLFMPSPSSLHQFHKTPQQPMARTTQLFSQPNTNRPIWIPPDDPSTNIHPSTNILNDQHQPYYDYNAALFAKEKGGNENKANNPFWQNILGGEEETKSSRLHQQQTTTDSLLSPSEFVSQQLNQPPMCILPPNSGGSKAHDYTEGGGGINQKTLLVSSPSSGQCLSSPRQLPSHRRRRDPSHQHHPHPKINRDHTPLVNQGTSSLATTTDSSTILSSELTPGYCQRKGGGEEPNVLTPHQSHTWTEAMQGPPSLRREIMTAPKQQPSQANLQQQQQQYTLIGSGGAEGGGEMVAGAAWKDAMVIDKHGLETFFSHQIDSDPYNLPPSINTSFSYNSIPELQLDNHPPSSYSLGPVEPPPKSSLNNNRTTASTATASSHIIIHHHHHYAPGVPHSHHQPEEQPRKQQQQQQKQHAMGSIIDGQYVKDQHYRASPSSSLCSTVDACNDSPPPPNYPPFMESKLEQQHHRWGLSSGEQLQQNRNKAVFMADRRYREQDQQLQHPDTTALSSQQHHSSQKSQLMSTHSRKYKEEGEAMRKGLTMATTAPLLNRPVASSLVHEVDPSYYDGTPAQHSYSFDDSSYNESLTDSSYTYTSQKGRGRSRGQGGGGKLEQKQQYQDMHLHRHSQFHVPHGQSPSFVRQHQLCSAPLVVPKINRQEREHQQKHFYTKVGGGPAASSRGGRVLPPRVEVSSGHQDQQQVQWWTPKIGNLSHTGLMAPSPPPVATAAGASNTRAFSSHDQNSVDASSSGAPPARLVFKDFYRKFRAKERTSFQLAEEYALECLEKNILPAKSHWKVHLELADLAKRANRLEEARRLCKKVCQLQPFHSQGWLEYSKLEEEGGNLVKTRSILKEGLNYCECSESLLTRAIKLEEKMGCLDNARQLLARLKNTPIDKVWRAVLEGALLEARDGKIHVARRILKYLTKHVPWYGPIYLEAFQLELREDRSQEALAIVDRGLNTHPRYGPLWFGAFRLCEKLDLRESRERSGRGKIEMRRTIEMVERALSSISKELLWKVHLEAAQVQERAALLSVALDSDLVLHNELAASRKYFARAVLTCPPNLSWKVWLAGGRMELNAGRDDIARRLFERAFSQVPEKNKANVFLECSRLEDFEGNTQLGRAILCKARQECPGEWKVYLESVMLEIRSGRRRKAIEIAQLALKVHIGTGRLWAILVQLSQNDGDEVQIRVLRDALKEVPKSGEVWCEGARIHLNPFSPTFDLVKAKRYLSFARQFTPQYGDSFLESLRLELLYFLIVPLAETRQQSIAEFSKKMVEENLSLEEINKAIVSKVQEELHHIFGLYGQPNYSFSFSYDNPEKVMDTTSLQLLCVNADPNYGTMWFHCRQRPTDTAKAILTRAHSLIICDLAKYAPIYVATLLRRQAVTYTLRNELDSGQLTGCLPIDDESDEWEAMLEARLRSTPFLGSYSKDDGTTQNDGFIINGGIINGSDFLTGLVDLNRHIPTQKLSPMARRKLLFGSDL
mmetsp:Transcript_23582/g.53815  ORF Transcript_23582/g.53815 Transcript_23582/m.53815 type:complete len:1913 (-) Transcript_23582:441-6179(-)